MFENIVPFAGMELYGNTLESYVAVLAVFIISVAAMKIFKYVVLRKLKSLAKKTKNDIDDLFIDVIDAIGWPFYIVTALYISVRMIVLPELAMQVLYYTLVLLGVFYVVKGIGRFIDFSKNRVIANRKKEEKEPDTTVISLLSKIAKGIIWLAALLFILSSVGYDISGAMVGVGVSGIVIGFALQNVLSDLFASFTIYFDKPFKIGDYIVIDNDMGTVKKIGIKSTRIQTLQGQELIISNRELTNTRINNYKRMERRRANFNIGVTYDTPTKKLKKIPAIIRDIIVKVELATPDRIHFKSYGDFSLNYEIVYYVESSEYVKYMDIQQEINFRIKEAFEKEGIEFAYPTQTIFLNK